MDEAKVRRLIKAVMIWRKSFNNFHKMSPQYPLSRFSLKEQERQINRANANTSRLEASRKKAFALARQLYKEMKDE